MWGKLVIFYGWFLEEGICVLRLGVLVEIFMYFKVEKIFLVKNCFSVDLKGNWVKWVIK